MNTEQKNQLKVLLLETCKELHIKTIENLKKEVDSCQQMANEYGPPKDRYDAFRSQMLRKRDLFAQQMQKANQELIILSRIKPDIKNKIELGTIIITDIQKYFVSVSMGKVIVNNESFLCISPAAPVYKVMAGLKAGDSAMFNNNSIRIIDVY